MAVLGGWAFSYERGTPVHVVAEHSDVGKKPTALSLPLSLSRSLALSLSLSLPPSLSLAGGSRVYRGTSLIRNRSLSRRAEPLPSALEKLNKV